MGWLFRSGYNRKDLIAERTKGWERTTDQGVLVTSTCLASCYRGGIFSGVLWSVWERTFSKDGQQVEPTQRCISCDLLRCEQGEWGYKDMEESVFPFYFSAPLKYLDMVPMNQFGGHAEWRECVRSYHSRQAEKRRLKRLIIQHR
jgi:hypothetical protein